MTSSGLLDAPGRRRSLATLPGYLGRRAPRNKGMRYPPDGGDCERGWWTGRFDAQAVRREELRDGREAESGPGSASLRCMGQTRWG